MSLFLKNLRKSHFNLLKTLYFNFKVFDFKTAVKLPVLLFGNIQFEGLHAGCVELRKVKRGVVKIGGGWHTETFGYSNRYKSFLRIKGKLVLGAKVLIQQGVVLSINSKATVTIGDNVIINERVTIHSKQSITINNNCWISWNTQIFDSSFHYMLKQGKLACRNAPVFLGRDVWVANNVSIMKGAYLPDYTVVAANSLVNKDFRTLGEHCLIGGVPAKFITNRVELLHLQDSKVDKLFNSPDEILEYTDIEEELQKAAYRY